MQNKRYFWIPSNPKCRPVKGKQGAGSGPTYDRAAQIFEEMSTSEDFAEFLTLPLYEEI